MTAHLGTFIPLHAQNPGWGLSGWNANSSWNQSAPWGQNTSWNQSAPWGQTTSWNQSAPWGQNTSWNQCAPWGNNAPVPASGYSYGVNLDEIAHGGTHAASTLAFVPHHGHVSGNTFVPASIALKGIGGTAVVGVPSAWQGGNQNVGGLTQSFATELSENHQEYVLSFDVPGIDIADLDISLTGNTILINGIRKNCHESATLAYSEIARGNISRAITVPFDVSPSKAINTSLENGVLKIRIAKEAQSEKKSLARKVKIS